MKILLIFGLSIGLLLAGNGQAEDAPFEFSSRAQEVRFNELIAQLRCLVCQNQSLADSHAPLAQDLRNEVYVLFQQGDSDAQIMQFLTDRYGDFVLYSPPLKASTLMLWAGPGIFLLIGVIMALRLVRQKNRLDVGAADDKNPGTSS